MGSMEEYLEAEESDAASAFIGKPQRLVKGIDMSKLTSSEGVTFEFADEVRVEEDPENVFYKDSEIPSGIGQWSALFDCNSFDEVALQMSNVDSEEMVMKKLIKPGVGETIEDQQIVWFEYNMYSEMELEPFDSTYYRLKRERFVVGSGSVLPGMEIAIRTMKKGEHSMFLLHWKVAFGALGAEPRIPREATILVDLTVCDVVSVGYSSLEGEVSKEDISALEFQQNLKQAKIHHQKGNKEFQSSNYQAAVREYRAGVSVLTNQGFADSQQEEQSNRVLVKLHSNLANCYNQLSKPQQACVACKHVLYLDPNHTKAMFMFGRALMKLSDFKMSKMWLEKAQRREPQNEEITREMKLLEQKWAAYQRDEKLLYSNMFAKSGNQSTARTKTQSELTVFEANLKETLAKHFDSQTESFHFPGNLVQEEIELCKKVAALLDLKATVEGDCCSFAK